MCAHRLFPPQNAPAEVRFWARVDKRGEEDCWNWLGEIHHRRGGYGRFASRRYKTTRAHRIAYELTIGPIPDGLVLDHLCRNRACVNPAHLEPVTVGENNRRGMGYVGQAFRKTHCKRGHEFDAANTRITKRGNRCCRTCDREYRRARRAA